MRRAAALGLAVVLSAGCGGGTDEPPAPADESGRVEALWEEVQTLYDRARETGESVPSDIYEWVRRDIENLGDWEYRVERSAASTDAILQNELNALGEERWELVWLERTGDGLRLMLKRPTRSYISSLPVSQLLKLLPDREERGGAS